MIHYHGTPITPESAAAEILRGRHGMVSFAAPQSLGVVAEVCQSFVLDNGAFTAWKRGVKPDWNAYADWVQLGRHHPGFDWALIPDVIDGDEAVNDALVKDWSLFDDMVPVWHLHESLTRFIRLVDEFPRVAIGSSGQFAKLKTPEWWNRMREAFDFMAQIGDFTTRIHGLRMMDPDVFTRFPFSSADSTNVARNISLDGRWNGTYAPATKAARGIVIAGRIEAYQSSPTWDASRLPGGAQ